MFGRVYCIIIATNIVAIKLLDAKHLFGSVLFNRRMLPTDRLYTKIW